MADIQQSRQEREARVREEAQQQQQREEEARVEEANVDESHSQEAGQPEKRPRTERCDKKGQMTRIYLTDSDGEAIADFVKDQDELYDKTSEHFKDKASKESPREEFARSCKLSVKVCKT